ncbi:MAG: hypothetical protein ACYC9M_09240 [Desulfobulbaceae bacterium]
MEFGKGGSSGPSAEDLRSCLARLAASLGLQDWPADHLPFCRQDITMGSESELQTAVTGSRDRVDLPRVIGESNYYRNIIKRTRTGEFPQRIISGLEHFLRNNQDNVWENSWVRVPLHALHDRTRREFEQDLLKNKADSNSGFRTDLDRYHFNHEGQPWARFPISYLLRLALSDWLHRTADLPHILLRTGGRLRSHFLNDNTSPETISFYLARGTAENSVGISLAKETALRFLTTQLLVQYASSQFRLAESGQEVAVYYAPHPPIRQRKLNDIISDSFYRELFINPCLAGWDRGEDKFNYMMLCHQTLSRSQLNAVAKMKEAGIINSNLVVLPNTCNVSLANNGIHITIGSRRLSGLLGDRGSGFTPHHEKYIGDLVIKIVEHFLPLFVGTYSAAPYRIAFRDFHPEKVLGFLPHQLDYTHLRMIWRRWRKKSANKILRTSLTPFGPVWLDKTIERLFGIAGDFVPDIRVIDYLVSLMSTETSPSLDGTLGNHERLKRDLAAMGIYDPAMSVYFLYRLREFSVQGYAGFEGRQYSLFERFGEDLGAAADLQGLMTAYAYKLVLSGEVSHDDIPDNPNVESERRQVFFQTAIGIPTFFVKKNTRNLFLQRLISTTANTRASHRYPGYIRVQVSDYQEALLLHLRRSCPELIEHFGAMDLLRELTDRIKYPGNSASIRLTSGILRQTGGRSAIQIPADEFNLAAEQYYRTTLCRRHTEQSFVLLRDEIERLDALQQKNPFYRNLLHAIVGDREVMTFWTNVREIYREQGRYDLLTISKVLKLLLLIVHIREQEGN